MLSNRKSFSVQHMKDIGAQSSELIREISLKSSQNYLFTNFYLVSVFKQNSRTMFPCCPFSTNHCLLSAYFSGSILLQIYMQQAIKDRVNVVSICYHGNSSIIRRV